MLNNLGNFTVIEQKGMTSMPQKAASAWDGAFAEGFTGASYKPIAYIGKQLVKGTNHMFIAEQTLSTANAERHIVTIIINEFDGKYTIVKDSIERII